MPDGILNLNKPLGPTSHDVVHRVRTLTGVRRVGHAGTLDPLATGVLLVCVGKATRVAEYLLSSTKVYAARVRLGISTTTFDAEGDVVSESPVEVTRDQVEAALVQFRGEILQVPPMYSALKRRGVPLYRLARQGIEVAREPRPVEIVRLELTAWEPPDVLLEVTCSSGTYVRVLAYDLGQALGCGAHLAALSRQASGSFHLEDAITLDELAVAVSEGRWSDYLLPLDAALSGFPTWQLDADQARRLCLGQTIPLATDQGGPPASGEDGWPTGTRPTLAEGEDQARGGASVSAGATLARACGPDGTLLALVTYDRTANALRPHKVFCSPES